MVTLCNKCVAVAETQSFRWHDPGFEKRLGVVDGHFVQDVIARTREFLDDPHVAGGEKGTGPPLPAMSNRRKKSSRPPACRPPTFLCRTQDRSPVSPGSHCAHRRSF